MQERRRYIRLNSCFPVEFSLYFIPRKPISEEYQGFTSDVSEGGLCVTARNLKTEDGQFILGKRTRLNLTINIPLSAKPISATADITWSKIDEKDPTGKTYLIGLSYKDINPEDKRRIFSYARRLKWIPRIAYAGLTLLFLGLLGFSFYHIKARRENQALVKQLVSVSEAKNSTEKQLNETRIHKEMLESKLLNGTVQVEGLKGEIQGVEAKADAEEERLTSQLNEALAKQRDLKVKIAELSTRGATATDMARRITETRRKKLQSEIDLLQMELAEVIKKGKTQAGAVEEQLRRLQEENSSLKQRIELTRRGETSLEEELAKIKARSGELEKASIEKMLEWIKVHQTKKTGLVLSYEGDKLLKNWGFSYDEALACQAFLISGDIKRAEKILNFYSNRAKRSKGLFYNAYDVKTGSPCEYTIHSGPNIWVGISACQYTRRTDDKKFLSVAEGIADRMINMQKASADGSIKGGPDVKWVSTEHNLGAYALFNMLYELTNNQKHKQAASVALAWLKDVGYNRPEERFMRGKGDSTIATDTFSVGIASIKPKTLIANGMNPDGIMEFAENECKVEATFYRPEGTTTKVVGFDFAKAQNLGRGGIVSTEWSAQMVVAFNIMADYYKKLGNEAKEEIYRLKAEYYLSQLSKMVISSPSPTGQGEGCLPYASIDNVDTGHGWRVAKGRRTGSVAATAYYIFASKNHNPLAFD